MKVVKALAPAALFAVIFCAGPRRRQQDERPCAARRRSSEGI